MPCSKNVVLSMYDSPCKKICQTEYFYEENVIESEKGVGLTLNKDGTYTVSQNGLNFVDIINRIIKGQVSIRNITKPPSADTSNCSEVSSFEDLSAGSYGDFGLENQPVYGYIAANTGTLSQVGESVFIRLIDWDNASHFDLKSIESEDDFFQRFGLKEQRSGVLIMPIGPEESGHWSTLISNLSDRSLHVFDSTLEHFKECSLKPKKKVLEIF